jgi:hypothetical protein
MEAVSNGQGAEGVVMTTYEAMKTARSPEIHDQDKARPRSSLRDHALLTFYIAVIVVSMGGWLWFLGSVSWRLASWIIR